jgi:hypothetical protein
MWRFFPNAEFIDLTALTVGTLEKADAIYFYGKTERLSFLEAKTKFVRKQVTVSASKRQAVEVTEKWIPDQLICRSSKGAYCCPEYMSVSPLSP